MTSTTVETDDTEMKDASPEQPRRRRLSMPRRIDARGVAGLIAVLLVAASVYVTVQWRQAEDLQSARSDALAAARVDAVTIASYDYRNLDDYFDAVGSIAAGSFAQQYDDANHNLRSVLLKTRSVVKAEVVDAGVESATTSHAVIVLFVDQTVRNSATHGTATDRNRMLMTLDRHGDRWLVSDLALK